ncbi:MAG: hypothetical protein D6820_17225, partial [Lentisphaerae bacterium]
MNISASIYERFSEIIQSRCGIKKGQRVVCGFSGGADSTALLLLLEEYGCDVLGVHIDHMLRGAESTADAEWCREFCAKQKIDFELHRVDVQAERRKGESLEMAARRLRLRVWQRYTAWPVALAHHR